MINLYRYMYSLHAIYEKIKYQNIDNYWATNRKFYDNDVLKAFINAYIEQPFLFIMHQHISDL